MPHETVQVLGVPVDNVTEQDVLAFTSRQIELRTPTQIATVNAEYVMRAQSDPAFKRVLERSALRTPDGAGVILAAWRRGCHIDQRVGGSDLVWSLAEQAARLGHRVFLLGGGEGVAASAAGVLIKQYPGLLVAGTFVGGPQERWRNEQVSVIRGAAPDILLVAFGAPEQDMWIDTVKEELGVPVIMGVGGSLDYVAGVTKRAPVWMQNYGLDWLFRLLRQPWRWRRMMVLPRFAILALARSD